MSSLILLPTSLSPVVQTGTTPLKNCVDLQILSYSRQNPHPKSLQEGPRLPWIWAQDVNTLKIFRRFLSEIALWGLHLHPSEVGVTKGPTAMLLIWAWPWGHSFTGNFLDWLINWFDLIWFFYFKTSCWFEKLAVEKVWFSNPASFSLKAFFLNSAWKLHSFFFKFSLF